MDILTLLKANIRHKKGSFISIILLMIVVTMSLSSIISVKDNATSASSDILEQLDSGNIVIYITPGKLTDELLETVKNYKYTKNVISYPALAAGKISGENGEYPGNGEFLQKLRPGYPLFNVAQNGYEEETPSLSKGEIYLTLGVQSTMKCNVGDVITVQTLFGDYEFKVKGFVVEPVNGSALIGWKQLFISDEDFDQMYLACKAAETELLSADYRVLHVYKTDDCPLSDVQFRRQLNLETTLLDNAHGSLTKQESCYYTGLFGNTILNILIVFVVFLFIIVLIILAHSITTGIEMEYVSLGVLKSQGFSNNKIKLVFALQYLTAQLIGTIIGIIISVPITKLMSSILQPLNAMLIESHISVFKVSGLILLILMISIFFIIVATRKIGQISPVKAITGGREEIYFNSRLHAPITKKGLITSLAFRQFTSAKRQYIGVVLIVSILVFFMMTMMLVGTTLSSKKMMESMGVLMPDVGIRLKDSIDDKKIAEIDNAISEITDYTANFYATGVYLSVEGEQIYTFIYKYPENIQGILQGRVPLYDNEVIITDIVADALQITIGDTLSIKKNDNTFEYLIVGIEQALNDGGMVVAMNIEGAKHLGTVAITDGGYNLSDSEKIPAVVSMLNEKFGDILEANELNETEYMGIYRQASNAMMFVIYLFSLLFTLVVVNMVCKKAFLKERTDIGIYKALGFTVNKLRLQFAFRYTLASVIGSALGIILNVMFSGKTLNTVLRVIGITNYPVHYTPAAFIFPVGTICICFFVFSFLAVKEIKNVEVRELVSE